MIKIFTGDDRIKAKQAITSYLGNDYEVIEGPDLTPADLPSIFLGASLFQSTRHILIRDLSTNKPVFEKLPDYLDSQHKIALLELKLDKRSSTYKALKTKIEIQEFQLPPDPALKLVFDIFKTAKVNGPKSLDLLAKIKQNEEPIMFFGLLTSQAIKDFSMHQGTKQKTILKELAKVDLQMKTSPIDPWLLIESFLLRLSSF